MNYNRHISIPEFILSIDEESEIILLLVKILGYQEKEINIKRLISDYDISREQIKKIVSKGYAKIVDNNGEICVDITPIYENEYRSVNNNILTANDINQISFILGREIKQHELEILNKFIDQGFTKKEIEIAIQKSLLNNVDSFSYIEAVLKNNKKTPSVDSDKIKRSVDLY